MNGKRQRGWRNRESCASVRVVKASLAVVAVADKL